MMIPNQVLYHEGLVAQETIFGWILSGTFNRSEGNSGVDVQLLAIDNIQEQSLNKFRDLESVGIKANELRSDAMKPGSVLVQFENLAHGMGREPNHQDDWLYVADSPAEAGLRFEEAYSILQEAEWGYGAYVHVRVPDGDKFKVSLAVARGKVALIKRVFLLRLELLGALLCSRLIVFVTSTLQLAREVLVQCWMDSTVALVWIKGDPNRWKTFVANRAVETQHPSCWQHCPGKDNQADLVSRGVFAEQLLQCSSLIKLDPYLDEDGLLRIKGCLENADLSFESRHPIIIPGTDIALLIVRFQYRLLKYAGVVTLVSTLRNSYWIICLHQIAKKVCRECVACRRCDATALSQPAGPLPELRVKSAPPFTVTGLNFAGPLFCVDFPSKKLYILLFTRADIRAVHLELTESLSVVDCKEPHIANSLTPSHFLIGRSAGFQLELAYDPSSSISSKDLCVREAVRLGQLDKFWRIWQYEYLRNLPCMVKGFKPNCNLKEGSVVLVKDERVSRLMWPLGVITNLYPGKDRVVRSDEVKTKRGSISRPVQNLYNLELTDLKGEMGRNSLEERPGNLRQEPAESPSVSNVDYMNIYGYQFYILSQILIDLRSMEELPSYAHNVM
ncbi:uncharacterized protein [Palaemon carinicauda]|uniref:uncharacterized protein n=1 Tax=Palaemon carinicauda TaxID=392227 RepID=UPI0035B640C6